MGTSTKGLAFYGHDFFVIKTDMDLVEESITRLIMTNWKERVGNIQFGGNLKPMLFEMLDDDTLTQLQTNLKEMIDLYEPRAMIESLELTADKDNSQLSVSLSFKYVGRPNDDARFLSLTLAA